MSKKRKPVTFDTHKDVCHECALALGAVMPPPGIVTMSMGKCSHCGEEKWMASPSDYNWPDGRKAVWD